MDRPLHVLAVDDEPYITRLLQRILTEAGYLVTAVNDGISALTITASAEPDMVLLDIRMPELDG